MTDSPSEAVLAARRKFQETSAATAAKLSESAERSIEATKKADASSRELGEKVKKIDTRVRELIEKRANAENSAHANEIQVGGEDDEEPQDEVALEFKDLIENYPIKPAATTPEAAETAGPISSGAAPPVAAAPQSEPPQPDPRWQVQAGRFGRRNEQPAPPPAAPKPPAPPKPAPRRPQPTFDDDDDYENQSWLR
jgi:hypothetical protein